MELDDLVARVPEGWTPVTYRGRRYGLSRTNRAGGRSVSVYAEELGGSEVISANVWRTAAGTLLRPCEMPAPTVLDFLVGWAPAADEPSAAGPADRPDDGRPRQQHPRPAGDDGVERLVG